MIRRSTNQLSIRPKMSARAKLTWIVCSILVAVGSIYAAYTLGVWSGHQQFEQDKATIKSLNGELKTKTQQLKEAQDSLIFAERQKQIQEEAYKQLSQAYANSEEKNQVLGTTLDFYRSIISPEDGQSGPAIQAFEVYNKDQDDGIRFDITLVQAIKHKVQIRGQLRVQLFAGDEMLGQWPQSAPRSVSYQYFVKVSGEIPVAQSIELQGKELSALVSLDLGDGERIERAFNVAEL